MARKDGGLPGFVGWIILGAFLVGPLLGVGIPLWLALTAKSYEFSRVHIDATLQPDGSLDLVEERTFDFDGEFSFAFFTVDWPVEQIEGFTVSEDGRELPITFENPYPGQVKARWEFDAQDEERTFTIRYRARCAVDVWADTAHLNWQFVGTGWDVPTRQASVALHLPGAATKPGKLARPAELCPPPAEPPPFEARPLAEGETVAFGHGPLGGEVRIPDPQTVTLEVADLPGGAFVEGSVFFPVEAVPFAYQTPSPMRDALLAQEAIDAENANAEREVLLAQAESLAGRKLIFWIVLGGLVLAFALLVVISRIRDRTPEVPSMLSEPPEEIHPVELAQLWGAAHGRPAMHEVYRTQMLHLAQIGAIELQAVGRVTEPEDFRVGLRDVKDAEPRDMEFLEFLFPGSRDEDISLSSLKPTGERKKELRQWWALVDTSGKGVMKKVLPEIRWESLTTTFLGVGGMLAAIFAIPFVDGPLGLLLFPVALIGMIVAHVLIRPRVAGDQRERVARWRAFRTFLTRFSSLPEAPALAVLVWERYLVYATALGCADEVEKQVKTLIPPSELPEPWRGAPSGLHGYAAMRSFTSVPVHTAASVAPRSTSSSSFGSSSSSFGGGGGFSSGGGGGGGGTGGGAG